MKFMMPNKRLLAVAIAADFVAVFPLFVVLAAQGQITEVNPSGVSGVQAIVTVGTGEDVRELNINAKTTWKAVPGKGKNRAVNASYLLVLRRLEAPGHRFSCAKRAEDLWPPPSTDA